MGVESKQKLRRFQHMSMFTLQHTAELHAARAVGHGWRFVRKRIRGSPKIFTKSEKNISNRDGFLENSLTSLSNLKNYYKS